ncbi:MAG: hypothetical protein KKB30_12000 [Proteobacteria bacterium]|nr:hypothetical protein [Pseudomonadota bacterium]MBU1716619.1 hypothetical protein [Pseudomonadota bacterium]
MKNNLDIIIHADGFTINQIGGAEPQFIGDRDVNLGLVAAQFCQKNEINSTTVSVYISEDQIFTRSFSLPTKTPSIKAAVKFQLGMLAPFVEEELLYNFASQRDGDNYRITLFAARPITINNHIQELIDAGFKVAGLYPENQRYVTSEARKNKWALIMPGQFLKVLIFSGTHLENRLLCNTELNFKKLAELCQTEQIYHFQPPVGSLFRNADNLLASRPLLKEFNLLPVSYHRPDYFKMAAMILIVINLIAGLTLIGTKLYQLNKLDKQVEEQIALIMPQVKEVRELRLKRKELTEQIEQIETIGSNPDIIDFLKKLTDTLPTTSYLDQLTMNPEQKSINIQGFTENIGEMTEKLQKIGETKLKSTSRRRDKTYFQVEINLP